MALILYPLDNYDTFVSVADADIIIGNFVPDAGTVAYLALDETGKEQILRQTALQIKLCSNIILPETLENDLELAQCYLTTHALQVDMIAYDPTSKSITAESVDVIATAYDVSAKDDADTFPSMVSSLLSQYGCTNASGGFSQSVVSRT